MLASWRRLAPRACDGNLRATEGGGFELDSGIEPGEVLRRGRERHWTASPVAVLGALFATIVLLPAPLLASPDTLRRSLEDLTMGVADIAVAPVTAGIAVADNLDAVSGNGFSQGVYTLPGWLGLTTLHVLTGVCRFTWGALELVPGIVLFPFSADLPDWDGFRSGEKLVDWQNPLAESPGWVKWVPLTTPATIDLRLGPVHPWGRYDDPNEREVGEYVWSTD